MQGGFFYNGNPVGKESRREIAYMSTEPYFYNWMTIKDVEKYYADFFEDFSTEEFERLMRRMELTLRYEDESAFFWYDGEIKDRGHDGAGRESISA